MQSVQNVNGCLLVSGTDCLMLQLSLTCLHLLSWCTPPAPWSVFCRRCQPEEDFKPLWLGNTISSLTFIEEYHDYPWITFPSTVLVVWECYLRASPTMWGLHQHAPQPQLLPEPFRGACVLILTYVLIAVLLFQHSFLLHPLTFLPSAQLYNRIVYSSLR